MTTSSHDGSQHGHLAHPGHRPQPAVITSARGSASTELSGRVKRYTYAMAFRMVCFLGMLVVDGWLRWALLAVAVFMPYLAVVLANQADQRSTAPLDTLAPVAATAITTGHLADEPGDVLTGEIITIDDRPVDRTADDLRPAA